MIRILELLNLVDVTRDKTTGKPIDCNNLTLINLVLVKMGNASESVVALRVLGVQVGFSVLGFAIRYGLAFIMYS